MAQDTIITAKTAAENSADFTVTAGTPKTLSFYSTEADNSMDLLVQVRVQRKNTTTGTYRDNGKFLSNQDRAHYECVLSSAGTYRVIKLATTKQVGILADS